jgi:trans-aconitate methyltransferase
MADEVATAWDAEYRAGRYDNERPVDFVHDIVAACRRHGALGGVYVGCGNGRNLVPLLEAGLDLIGLDISQAAIDQLRQRRPDLAQNLIVGDLNSLPTTARYDLVVGIQVFQHGDRHHARQHLRGAATRVAPGGLLCIRVNASTTDVEHAHRRFEADTDGSFTVRYLTGPKAGLNIHFYSADELDTTIGDRFAEILTPRLHSTQRTPERGQWSQWEAIWQRRT